MESMFAYCLELTDVNLSGFVTSKVTNMSNMFACCNVLPKLDVTMFDTSKVTNMREMFALCNYLETLDLSSFNTSKVTNTYHMFYGSDFLKTIYVGNGWNMSSVTDSTEMFLNALRLQGKISYNPSYLDKTYATVDYYLTKK
jgi:surface protein